MTNDRKRITELTETTTAKTDHYIPVDHEEDGTQKMSLATLVSGAVQENIEEDVNKWLEDHPEATTSVEDHSLTYEKLVNGTLGFVTPEMYGAKGDGVADDTIAIQTALNEGKHVLFANTYLVSIQPETVETVNGNSFGHALMLSSNQSIEFSNGAEIKLKANSYDGGYIFTGTNVKSVKIFGNGTITGDKLTHQGSNGEWGHGVNINNSEDIEITGISIQYCWGDGIYIGSGNISPCVNVFIHDCNISHNSRNNISIVACDGCFINNVIVNYADRVAPFCGIDIEPNENGLNIDYVKNCIISNVIANRNERYGVLAALYTTNTENYVKMDNITADRNIGILCSTSGQVVECTNYMFKPRKDDTNFYTRQCAFIGCVEGSHVTLSGIIDVTTSTNYVKNIFTPHEDLNNFTADLTIIGDNGFNNIFSVATLNTHKNVSVKALITCPQTAYGSDVGANLIDNSEIEFSDYRVIGNGTQTLNPIGAKVLIGATSGALYVNMNYVKIGAKFTVKVLNRGSSYGGAFSTSLPDNSITDFICCNNGSVSVARQITF